MTFGGFGWWNCTAAAAVLVNFIEIKRQVPFSIYKCVCVCVSNFNSVLVWRLWILLCMVDWLYMNLLCGLFLCSLHSQSRVSRNHRGTGWGPCCFTESSQLQLPSHTGIICHVLLHLVISNLLLQKVKCLIWVFCLLSVFVLKLEMENPVRNKKCNHHYDEKPILSLIKTKHSQKKKCR